jgi:hypothetical protein
MAPNIAAQAAQAAQQGQARLADYNNKASTYKGSYDSYQSQADEANKKVASYTDYMAGEGSAANQYKTAFETQKGELGYNPEQMTAARANLNQATGALSAYSDFANTAASKWGMNAGGFAAANAGALGSINNNIASNQGVVNSLADLYKTAQTGANQFTGQVIAGQHETLAGYQQTFANASSQRDSAGEMMNFYNELAQKQGGLNAQEAQFYASARQAYAQAEQAMAQAALLSKQVIQAQQQIDQSNAYTNSPAYKNTLAQNQAYAQQGGTYDSTSGNWKMPGGQIITPNGIFVKDTSTNRASEYMNIGRPNAPFGSEKDTKSTTGIGQF